MLGFNSALANDIASLIAGKSAGIPHTNVVAGSGNNNVWIFGAAIQRSLLSQAHNSAKLQWQALAVSIASGQFCLAQLKVQTSDDGSTWNDYTYRPSGFVQVPASFNFDHTATEMLLELPVALVGAGDYIRAAINLNFTAGSADVATPCPGLWNFGGGQDIPAVV